MTKASSSSAQAARQRLADQLREIRLDAKLSGRALAARAAWHGGSKISKIEHGVRSPSAEDIQDWCRVCGIGEGRAAELIAELRAVESTWLDWKRAERTGLLHLHVQMRSIFERTRLLRAYSSKIVPGLLQTADYTTAVLSAIRDSRAVPVDDVAATVAERMNRQHILREGDHRFVFLAEEAVLRYRVGDVIMMIDQLHHLKEVATLSSLSFGIIPGDADRSVQCPAESFTMFDRRRVSVELISGYLTVTQPGEIERHEKVFADLLALTVVGKNARTLIDKAIRELE
ncbi:MAG: helix-turn-helix domain-containing protein [Pseudonocardiaceae bacterium]